MKIICSFDPLFSSTKHLISKLSVIYLSHSISCFFGVNSIPISAMSDCLPSTIFPPRYSLTIHKFGFNTYLKLPKKSAECSIHDSKKCSISLNCTRNWDAIPFPSDEHEYDNLGFGLTEKEKSREIGLRIDEEGKKDELEMEEPAARPRSGIHEEEALEDLSIGEMFKFRDKKKGNKKLVKDEDFTEIQGLDSKFEELERHADQGAVPVVVKSRRRQMMRRSNVIAKQVISIRSAISLGFVSQLWVDTSTWVVLVVEVRPNLLSGDSERFLLKEIVQLGDVILVEDENVTADDFKLVGLETLVGYNVVTPSRQSIGKVRGYSFNINTGAVESLELDSFGISIIPSSLVSTYALFVEDVVEVLSDTVVVHEAAVSRIQRLTKGLWGGQNAGNSNNELEEQLDVNGQQDHADYIQRRRRKSRRKKRKGADEWELPMDFL
ncbi:hypothetical protein BUALT_Bualt09G0137400 [Buddleja alternifolia]|uniref:PRC-barrel domain-containing protein n=1 Tax=Buddleja alternifolia TaxID=168488 RepID=A0AAV6X425_9LAMI|nr:hypothetical protein BUALT_Bualt09G0137400 [Buddleja alternifolia]